jgi:hypothetical protein
MNINSTRETTTAAAMIPPRAPPERAVLDELALLTLVVEDGVAVTRTTDGDEELDSPVTAGLLLADEVLVDDVVREDVEEETEDDNVVWDVADDRVADDAAELLFAVDKTVVVGVVLVVLLLAELALRVGVEEVAVVTSSASTMGDA